MARNKKAQILAAVMCASSIFGSYTMVSAETSISNSKNDVSASVATSTTTETINGEKFDTGRITATANNGNSQTSTITLQGNSLGVNVGYDSSNKSYEGTFTLNSKNFKISSAGAITGTKLTIDGRDTGTGLTVDGAATSSIISRNPGNWDEYTSSRVAYNGVTDTVYASDGITKLASSSVSKSGENGKITLTTNKYNDKEYGVGNKISSATLTLDGENVTLSGKNASLNASGLILKDSTGTSKGGISSTGAVSGTSLKINATTGNTSTINSKDQKIDTSENKTTYSVTGSSVYDTVSNNVKTYDDKEGSRLISDINNKTTSSVSATGVSNTVIKEDVTDSQNKITNKVISGITATSVSDTLYVNDKQAAKSNVGITSISDTVYGNDGKTAVASSGISKTVSEDGTESGSVSLTANKIKTDSSTLTSRLSLTGDSAQLTSGSASVKVDNATGNVAITANKNGTQGYVTLSGKNATLSGSTFTLIGEDGKQAILNTSGLTLKDSEGYTIGGVSSTGAVSGTSLKINATTGNTSTINSKDQKIDTSENKTTYSVTGSSVYDTVSNNVKTYDDKEGSRLISDINNKTTSSVSATGVSNTVIKEDVTDSQNKITNKVISGITATSVSDTLYVNDKQAAKSNVGITSISDTVYGNDGKTAVASSGISKTVSEDGTESGSVSLTANKINGSEKSTSRLSLTGDSAQLTSGSAYVKADNATGNITLSGKNVGLNANGLTLYKDVEGVKTQYASLTAGGLNVNGTGYTTIKSTNATTGAMGASELSYSGVTDTVTNAAGNKTTSIVRATGTRDQVYDTDGKTRIAYSEVTTNTITDSFTKDGVTNSVTTYANGTKFESTGNGSTTIKGDTIKTTNLIVNGKDIGGVATDVAGIDRNTENEDGLGYYTQIEGKTKIYNTGRFSTANGNFVVDPYGSITSKAGNYRFNMDRTNGFDLGYAATTSFTLDNTGVSLGFRNNSFILDKNGATFINANGENVSFTSINGGTITTGETVINGSSITTKDLYVDNIHLNGAITDGNGNVVGGGDLSLGADGTLDLKYNANGITNTFVSGATGVHSSFSNGTTTASSSVGYIDDKNTIGIKDQVGNTSVTTTTDGTTFANGSGSTTINGGNITTTGDVTVGGDLSVGDNFKVDGTTGNVTGGTYNGVQISTDKDGNAIIGGTNIGDLATNEEVNKVNDKVDAVDNKVGDTSKLDKEITDNQNYKDNQNLVGAVNAEADIRRNEISRIDGQIEQLDGRVGSLENRMSDVEDRIDKVGAMSAAIANLRTMGFDPEAPTEIAIGVGQYKSETGLALGVFHYPNQDFMLSASISTSGDEVMGGIGATWKLGRKSAAEKAKDEEARRLEKAEEMKKLAQDAKVKAQAERHAKLLAEREAQKTA